MNGYGPDHVPTEQFVSHMQRCEQRKRNGYKWTQIITVDELCMPYEIILFNIFTVGVPGQIFHQRLAVCPAAHSSTV